MPKGGLLGERDGCNRHIPALKRNGMKLFVGMDVSLAKTAIRAGGEHGEIVEEAGAASEPEVLARWPGGLPRNFGLKVGAISRGGFEARIRELAEGNLAMLRARSSLRLDLAALEKQVRRLARGDPVCLRSMTMPGIGTVVALAHLSRTDGDNGSPFRSAVADPAPLRSSKRVGPWVSPTASCNRSGERDVSVGITKAGDVNPGRALCQGATVATNRGCSTWLRTWAARLAQRRGGKIATVALARRIAVVLHRIRVGGTMFRPDAAPEMA